MGLVRGHPVTGLRADRTFEQRYVFCHCNAQSAILSASTRRISRGGFQTCPLRRSDAARNVYRTYFLSAHEPLGAGRVGSCDMVCRSPCMACARWHDASPTERRRDATSCCDKDVERSYVLFALELPADGGARIPLPPLPAGVASQTEPTAAASPPPTATASRPARDDLRCGVRPQPQRDARRQRQPRHQALLMRQIAHLPGFPLPGARLPVAEQGRNRRPLAIKRDQLPAPWQTAAAQQRLLMRPPPERAQARRPPSRLFDDQSGAVPAFTTLTNLRADQGDAAAAIPPAGLAVHRRQPRPAVRRCQSGKRRTGEGAIRDHDHARVCWQDLRRLRQHGTTPFPRGHRLSGPSRLADPRRRDRPPALPPRSGQDPQVCGVRRRIDDHRPAGGRGGGICRASGAEFRAQVRSGALRTRRSRRA